MVVVMVMVAPAMMAVMMMVVVTATAPLFTLPRLFLTPFSGCSFQRALQRHPLLLAETLQNFLHVRHVVTASFIEMPYGLPSRPGETAFHYRKKTGSAPPSGRRRIYRQVTALRQEQCLSRRSAWGEDRAAMSRIRDPVARDVDKLPRGGVDALLVCNEGDRPPHAAPVSAARKRGRRGDHPAALFEALFLLRLAPIGSSGVD